MRAPKRLAFVSLALLSACGDAQDEGGAPRSGKAAWAAWNPIDACATFPAARAGAAAGAAVTNAELDHVHPFGDGGAAVSQCRYTSDRGAFGILLREAEKGDGNARGIVEIRSGGGITAPAEDLSERLSGLPGVALWQAKLGVLSYFPDDRRMIVVHPYGALPFGKRDPDDELKARALAIARAIERP